MNSPTREAKNWLIASLIVESARDFTPSGPRPSEEEIVAWAEGILDGDHATRVLHWVVHDPQCYELYQSYLEFAFEPESASEDVIRSVYSANEQAVSQSSPDSINDITHTPISTRLDAWWHQLFPMPATVAVVAALFVVVPILVTRNAPIEPEDFVNNVSSPAANWQFVASIEPTGRSPQSTARANDRQALRFGMRTMISELGVSQHTDVRAYYNSLPIEYPFCSSTNDSCEAAHRFHYDLGRWVMLTERICRVSLAEEDRGAMLSKQALAYTKLVMVLESKSLLIDNQLKSILDTSEETACSRTERIYQWSQS